MVEMAPLRFVGKLYHSELGNANQNGSETSTDVR